MSAAKKEMYLGWRSQERLDIGPVYLTNPAQRLASSAVQVKQTGKEMTEKKVEKENISENIKEVTEAIMDFCKTSRETKIAWEGPNNDEDDVDGDSGFDKSEDLSKEILNEVSFYHF